MVQSPYAGSDGCQDAQDEKIGASQSEMSSLGGAVRSGIEQGSTSGSSLGAGQGVPQGCGTHTAESASPKVSNRAGKRPAEAPAPAVSRRRPPSPKGVLDPKNDSTGLDTDLFDERDWPGIKTELNEHSTVFAELLVTLQPDDPSTGRELARQAHRDLMQVWPCGAIKCGRECSQPLRTCRRR